MNHLLRELAPISDAAWAEIDSEAKRTLSHFLAARKLVDFNGPLGYDASALSLGRLEPRGIEAGLGVVARRRQVQALVELSRSFTLHRGELESIDRGACNADLDPLREASESLARAEDLIVFDGLPDAGIAGIGSSSPHPPIGLTESFAEYPNHVARAVATLKEAGISARTPSPSGRAATRV